MNPEDRTGSSATSSFSIRSSTNRGDGDHACAGAMRIEGRLRDVGTFKVHRFLPSRNCPSVGPFVFFDHAGPADLAPGQGMDVPPHPHIGLATVTYLFEGGLV